MTMPAGIFSCRRSIRKERTDEKINAMAVRAALARAGWAGILYLDAGADLSAAAQADPQRAAGRGDRTRAAGGGQGRTGHQIHSAGAGEQEAADAARPQRCR